MKDLHPGIAPPFVGSGIFQARFRFVALSSGANQPEKHRNPTGGAKQNGYQVLHRNMENIRFLKRHRRNSNTKNLPSCYKHRNGRFYIIYMQFDKNDQSLLPTILKIRMNKLIISRYSSAAQSTALSIVLAQRFALAQSYPMNREKMNVTI